MEDTLKELKFLRQDIKEIKKINTVTAQVLREILNELRRRK